MKTVGIKDVEFRKSLIRYALSIIDQYKDDPRYDDARKHYERQLQNLEERSSTPPPVVVGLNPAKLAGKAN